MLPSPSPDLLVPSSPVSARTAAAGEEVGASDGRGEPAATGVAGAAASAGFGSGASAVFPPPGTVIPHTVEAASSRRFARQ